MSYKKEIMTGVATLAIAVGVGFIMQRTDAADQRYGQASIAVPISSSSAASAPDETAAPTEPLDVQGIELTSASQVDPVAAPSASIARAPDTDPAITRVAAAPDTLLSPPVEEALPSKPDCDVQASARAIPGAMVSLELEAPCAINERVTVHHNGLMFSYATNDTGGLRVLAPAMSEQAVFIFALPNGDGAVAQINVPDIDGYARIALQWRGQAGFQLHAREFGANYGETGHIWSETEANLSGLQSGQNGFLMRVGNEAMADPLVAEIYSFASAKATRTGLIDVSVEAEVTAVNCGKRIEAQSFEIGAGGSIKTHDLTLHVPGCDAIGDFLVLNNLIPDMTVAAN